MKKYYSTLNKKEKEKIKNIYKKDYQNSTLQKRFIRLIIYAIIGYVISILLIIDAYINHETIWSYIIAISLFIASTIFLVGKIIVKRNVLNKIAIKQKKV